MIQSFGVSTDKDIIKLYWEMPAISPYKYIRRYACIDIRDRTIKEGSADVGYTTTCVWTKVAELQMTLGSLCFINLRAVYNTASLDAGITVIAKTFERKYCVLVNHLSKSINSFSSPTCTK